MKTLPIPRRPKSCYSRNKTGCVGISLRARTEPLKSGPRVRFYFQVLVGAAFGHRRWLQFRIDKLGRQEAWRRAVAASARRSSAARSTAQICP